MMELNEELLDKSNRNIMITKEEIERAENTSR